MFAVANSEVLANDWLPPIAIGREREVQEVVRRLDPPSPVAPPPWIVAIAGPSGSGSSTVARRAAREVADRIREATSELAPRVVAVRTALSRGTHGVATTLLQRFDEGFDGRGFPVAEIVAGFLRRLRRDRRPAVLVLDDVEIGGPDLSPILRAFGAPDRFLPEGESGLPPVWTILAGSSEGLATATADVGPRIPLRPFVALTPYPEPVLRSLVRDRAERAIGRSPPSSLVARIVDRSITEGGGSRRAFDLLRRELLGAARSRVPSFSYLEHEPSVAIEPHVVRAIGGASRGLSARLGDVRRLEAELAQREGLAPLPTTTLWRRIIRLERAGYVRREIRTGGSGGTLSVVRLLTPIDEWVTAPARTETLRASAPFGGSASARPAGPGVAPPDWSPSSPD